MEVHTAKLDGEKIECRLCEYEAKDLENIEIHLATCEYFKCAVCENLFGNLLNSSHKVLSRYDRNGVNNIKQ